MRFWIASLVLVLLSAAAAGARGSSLVEELRRSRLLPEQAVAVEKLRLEFGIARLEIRRGTFVPVSGAGGQIRECVFLGDAKVLLDPPDEIEEEQLELFTDARRLRQEVTAAVLVIASDAASNAIFDRPSGSVDPASLERAVELYETWRESSERDLFGVETGMLRDALGDPFYAGFFVGWFEGAELGTFLYLLTPDDHEQVTLGRFVPLEASEKEKRKLSRQLRRQQRRGRWIGMELDDFRVWDTWVSASLRAADGSPRPGFTSFEPEHYELRVEIDDEMETLRGRARVRLRAQHEASRIAAFTIHSDLEAKEVHTAAGEPLFFFQEGSELLVEIPSTADGLAEVVIDYEGVFFDRFEKTYILRDSLSWYPHLGQMDRATYDVTFDWPQKVGLVAPGEKRDGGAEDARAWERRVLELPALGYSFGVARGLEIQTAAAGHVEVVLALDPTARGLIDKEEREELLATATAALAFYEQAFGPYPLDRLLVVPAATWFSQGLLGIVTLSVLDEDDRKSVLAHEIAHQWWGNMVGWTSYRDQWISEAMANYSALLFARSLPEQQRFEVPTRGWMGRLLAATGTGRTIEAVGPLVLGARLRSSLAPDAYYPIVYLKGAVVLDMIARFFGEEQFVRILKALVAAVDLREISTEDFLTLIERIGGRDLQAFARKYVYATGLPQVYYSYEFSRLGNGKWAVTGKARQRSPYYTYRYQIVEREGRLDIERQRRPTMKVDDSVLVVPVQIAVYDPGHREEDVGGRKGRGKKDSSASRLGNRMFLAHELLQGEEQELYWELPYEPKELWLDRDGEVFGRFFNEERYPKRILLYQGQELLAEGKSAEAEATFRRALAAEALSAYALSSQALPGHLLSGFTLDGRSEKTAELEGQLVDAQVHLALARLYLDQARRGEAGSSLVLAEELLKRAERLEKRDDLHALARAFGLSVGTRAETLESRLGLHKARLLLQEGDDEAAFRELKKLVLRRGHRGKEGWLLLAISAHRTGRGKELGLALEALEGADIDLSRLADSEG